MFGRIMIYFKEMFPASAMGGTIITALAIQLVYFRLHDLRFPVSFPLIVPGIVLTALTLLLRIMDEFKDFQDDLTHFPERPLPSGRVKKSDLAYLAITCVVTIIFLSSTSKALLIWGLVNLGYAGLMYKWFFVESLMRKSLPLAFISHHPIVLFNFIYLLISCTQMHPEVTLEKWYYILPVCLIYTNWEIVRKIRAPKQETGYTTYSKLMGPRKAMSLGLILQLGFIITVHSILYRLSSPWWLHGGFILIQLALTYPGIKFLLTLELPKPLRPLAEGQILTVVLALLVAALL
jgi:4-hydroxybenzoate polyprenyltransferase